MRRGFAAVRFPECSFPRWTFSPPPSTLTLTLITQPSGAQRPLHTHPFILSLYRIKAHVIREISSPAARSSDIWSAETRPSA